MSPTDRPRRTNANIRPAEPVLKLRIPRRSPAEVAQERAAVEAQRQELLKRREEDMRALAMLEAKLKRQDEEAAKEAARPPSQNAVTEVANQRTSATPTGSAGGHSIIDQPAPGGAKASRTRLKKSTRADFEAYRARLDPGSAVLQSSTGRDLEDDQGPSTEQASAGVPQMKVVDSEPGPTRKRKASDKDTSLGLRGGDSQAVDRGIIESSPTTPGQVLSRPATKKSKRGIPGGLTVSAKQRLGDAAATTVLTANAGSRATTQDEFAMTHIASTPPAISVHPGGYVEDQTAEQLRKERQDLPIRNQDDHEQREPRNAEAEQHTTKGIIQVEVVDVSRAQPQASRVTSDSIPVPPPFDPALGIVTKTSSSWQMKDLQPILGPFIGRFGLQFIPKLINLVGNLANGPWQLYGLNLPRAMEDLARSAKQKLSDYRNDVASKAVEVVGEFMRSRRFQNAPQTRKEWVAWALSDELRYPFRYGEVIQTPGGQKRTGIYQGKLIVKTLAYHIKRIQLRADQVRDHPCNALALATTAVERALKMWQSGEFNPPLPRSEESKFSDKLWGNIAKDYLQSIINLSDVQWEKILRLAEAHYRGLIEDSDVDDSEDDHGDYDPRNVTAATSGRGGWISEEDDDEDDSSLSPLSPVAGEGDVPVEGDAEAEAGDVDADV